MLATPTTRPRPRQAGPLPATAPRSALHTTRTLDPRRNLAATSAGFFGVALAAGVWLLAPTALSLGWLILVAAAITSLAAGAWPSRRVRFLLLVPVVIALTLLGISAPGGHGTPILLMDVVATYGLYIEYARHGRD